jgi:hypothetical protein
MTRRKPTNKQQAPQASQEQTAQNEQLVVGVVLEENSPWELRPVDAKTAKLTMDRYKADGIVITHQNSRSTTILRPIQVAIFSVEDVFSYQPPQQQEAQVVPSEQKNQQPETQSDVEA